MTFGFKLYGKNLRPSQDLDALQAELADAKQLQPILLSNIFEELGYLTGLAATYLLIPSVSYGGGWYEPFFENRDGRYATNWAGAFVSTDTYPPTITSPIAKLQADPNYNYATYLAAVSKLNSHIMHILTLEGQLENAYCTVYDSSSIAWNQVDMFLVPAGLTTTRTYPYLVGRTLRATQMFVNTHPQDGTGEAGKGLAPLVEISGTRVTVSGGNRDTYIMVVMQ